MRIENFEDLHKAIISVHEALAKTEDYPESAEKIEYWLEFADELYEDFLEAGMDIASTLHEADGALPLHPAVAELLTSIYEKGVEKGDSEAACDLGSLYYTGRAGTQDYEKAAHYYHIADKGGDRQATENLGYIYYYGRIGKRDYEKAFNYFIKGAFDGHLRSLYKVGDFYKNGYYVEKDEKEAFRIYQQCVKMVSDESAPLVGADIYMRMGDCFFEGCGVDKDMIAASKFLSAAENMFYVRLMEGDFYQQKNLEHVLERLSEIRKIIKEEMLPDLSWSGYNE